MPVVDTVPQEHIERLADIFSRDEDYLLACLTVALVLEHNPGIALEDATRLCLRIEPKVSDQILEVISSSVM